MPFTPSHAAAVLPIAKRFPALPLSALAIGSMTPDFPYFLLFAPKIHLIGHFFPGVLTFDVPAGFAVFLLWHYFLKTPFFALLPDSHRRRLTPIAHQRPIRRGVIDVVYILIALFIGALTHLLWDSITHTKGFTVRHFPILATPLLAHDAPYISRFPLCNALQHLSTIFGLAAVAVAYRSWYRQPARIEEISEDRPEIRPVSARTRLKLIAAILIISPIVGTIFSYSVRHRLGSADFPKKRLADAVEGAMTTGSLIFLGFAIRRRARESQNADRLSRL